MAATTTHNWLAIAALALHLLVVVRLLYLEQRHMWFEPEDGMLIIISWTCLAVLVIDGAYLSVALGLATREMHHLAAFAVVVAGIGFLFLQAHSKVLSSRRGAVRATLLLYLLNSVLIFLAYWVSSGAAMEWWLYPDRWIREIR